MTYEQPSDDRREMKMKIRQQCLCSRLELVMCKQKVFSNLLPSSKYKNLQNKSSTQNGPDCKFNFFADDSTPLLALSLHVLVTDFIAYNSIRKKYFKTENDSTYELKFLNSPAIVNLSM